MLIAREWGLPDKTVVTAATHWQGDTYLFSGSLYYKINKFNKQPETGYPKKTNEDWFNNICV